MLDQEEKQAIIDLFPFLSEHPVIFDVGSNKGGWSDVILQEYPEGKCELHLFEPNKMLLDFTRIKFEYEKNITFNEIGLSNKAASSKFFYFENHNNEISSLFPDIEGWKDLPMQEGMITTTTIDEYCKKNNIERIDFLKLDIEGAEYFAIEGCKKMMSEGKIKIIQIEYGGHYVRANTKFQDVINIANSLGYAVYKYYDNNFHKLNDFVEDYAAENYYITKEAVYTYTKMGFNSRFIETTFLLPKFDLILEVGAFEGVTTKYMCESMLNEGGRVIVVDPLNDYYVTDDPRYHPEFKGQYQRFIRNTRGLPVELHRGLSEHELPKMNALRFDFSYIDGNHYPDWPYFDGCWAFAMTKSGGYILFDDYNMWAQETKDSIDKFLNEFSSSLEIVSKAYQVLIRKTQNQYNDLTYDYYK